MARPFSKVLVANRGEIARRVFAGCRSLGLATVAVHSDADADAPFVAEADEAVPLGGTTAAESYLDVDKVLEAAAADRRRRGPSRLRLPRRERRLRRARASPPGSPGSGRLPAAIEAMGSKVRARALMEEAGVPIVPGRELGDGRRRSRPPASEVGYPLLVKASAGGGGKGMRPVADPGELEAAVEGARREAEAAFGDPTVFLERYLQRPRHIEIQVLADAARPPSASASASARSSAVIRRSSRRRRRSRSRRSSASASAPPRSPPPRRSATSAPAPSSSCSTSRRTSSSSSR